MQAVSSVKLQIGLIFQILRDFSSVKGKHESLQRACLMAKIKELETVIQEIWPLLLLTKYHFLYYPSYHSFVHLSACKITTLCQVIRPRSKKI